MTVTEMQTMFWLFVFSLLFICKTTSSRSSSAVNAVTETIRQRTVQCSSNETRCWEQGKLSHTDGQCHEPLQQGPCPDDQWFALDGSAESNFLQGKCVELRCPPDRTSPQCRRQMQAHARACPRRASGAEEFAVHMNPAGQFRCGDFPGRVRSLHDHVLCAPNELGH